MLNLPAILTANGLGAALMVTLLWSCHRKVLRPSLDDTLFSGMCLLTLGLCICESVSSCLDGRLFPGAHEILLVLNSSLFFANSVLGFLWLLYVHAKLFGKPFRSQKKCIFSILPAGILCLLSVANLFTDVFFSLSQDNVYQRTLWFPIPYLVSTGYIVWGAILVFSARKKIGQYLFMPILTFLTPIFVGSLLQLHFYGLSFIWVCVSLGLTSLYINLQHEVSLIDSLTKLYNREYLIQYLNSMGKISASQSLAGIMMDINSFKQINDTYGHSEGDWALRQVGSLLLGSTSPQEAAIRYGGDEFIILSQGGTQKSMEALMLSIEEKLNHLNQTSGRPYLITLSMGISIYDPQQDTAIPF